MRTGITLLDLTEFSQRLVRVRVSSRVLFSRSTRKTNSGLDSEIDSSPPEWWSDVGGVNSHEGANHIIDTVYDYIWWCTFHSLRLVLDFVRRRLIYRLWHFNLHVFVLKSSYFFIFGAQEATQCCDLLPVRRNCCTLQISNVINSYNKIS